MGVLYDYFEADDDVTAARALTWTPIVSLDGKEINPFVSLGQLEELVKGKERTLARGVVG